MSRTNELGFIRRISTSRTSHRYVLVLFLIAKSSLLLYHCVVVSILVFQAGRPVFKPWWDLHSMPENN